MLWKRESTLVWIFLMNTRRKLELHAQTLGAQTPPIGSAILLVGEGGKH
jgi:hypothetical protein